jgi:hypothetical protein
MISLMLFLTKIALGFTLTLPILGNNFAKHEVIIYQLHAHMIA